MLPGLYVPLALVATVVGLGLALFAWLHRDTPGGGPLSLFLLTASLLSFTSALSLSVWGQETIRWAQLSYAIGALLPLAWLLTVLEYAGKEEWLTPRNALVLLVEPIAFAVLVLTSDSHSLVWSEVGVDFAGDYVVFSGTEGLAFWGHLAYAYLLIVIGATVLLPLMLRGCETFRDQSTALLASIAVPMIVNAVYTFELFSLRVDLSGLAFALSGAVLASAMLRNQLLDVSPAARELGREQLADDLDEPVVIVDAQLVIVDTNPPAERLLNPARSTLVGHQLAETEPALADVVEDDERREMVELDCDGQPRYYDIQVSEFHRAYGAVSGYIVSLRDVTERTRRDQRLDVMNRLFRHNLRNEMSVVRGNAELIMRKDDQAEVERRTRRIIDTVDEVISRSDKVGTLSRSLEDSLDETVDLKLLSDSAANSVRNRYPDADITVTVPDTDGPLLATAAPSVEFALTELIENAAEHHHDPPASITVTLRASAETLTVEIADDGPGIPQQELSVVRNGTETPLQHASGIGLWMVRWLIERAGGTIDFESSGGTSVTIRFFPEEATTETTE